MAESVSAVKDTLGANASWGNITIKISSDNVEVAQEVLKNIQEAARDVSKASAASGALYLGYKLLRPIVDGVVRRGLGGERDDQEIGDIRSGSLHVLLRCLTEERFLEVLEDYGSGRMKERLQKEFSQVGIKVEGLKVEIENMKEVNEANEAIVNKRYVVL